MEKGEGWGADYDARRRTADWQFQWFEPDQTSTRTRTPPAASHAARASLEAIACTRAAAFLTSTAR